jgi:RNA polymerase sigma-32 factor
LPKTGGLDPARPRGSCFSSAECPPGQHRLYCDELDARRELLILAMEALNDREKDILVQRRLSDQPVTLEDLSESYGVSRERIRQIEVRAFEKLQTSMRELARGKGMLIPD